MTTTEQTPLTLWHRTKGQRWRPIITSPDPQARLSALRKCPSGESEELLVEERPRGSIDRLSRDHKPALLPVQVRWLEATAPTRPHREEVAEEVWAEIGL